MGYGVVCQSCGIEAPSKQITLHQNIGALLLRYHRSARGRLCKNCIHKNFWSMTPITMTVGWLGTISMIVAPIFVINNIVQYLIALGMPAVPEGARKPEVSSEVMAKLEPVLPTLWQRLENNENLHDIARDLGPKAGVTPGETFSYVVMLAQAQAAEQAAQRAAPSPHGAFPVIMPPPLATTTSAPPTGAAAQIQ